MQLKFWKKIFQTFSNMFQIVIIMHFLSTILILLFIVHFFQFLHKNSKKQFYSSYKNLHVTVSHFFLCKVFIMVYMHY